MCWKLGHYFFNFKITSLNKVTGIDFPILGGHPQLKVPVSLFQIALTNLVRNAIQHTASGKIRVAVTGDRVIVSDTGSGIAKKNLNFITQAHVRGDSSNGFGLGLSIVQRLCVRFAWNLKIKSEVGQGTVVELIFGSDSS